MPNHIDLPNDGASIATVNGPKQWDAPFPDLTDELVFTQQYIQDASSFVPLALDTPHTDIHDAYLVEEGPREDVGGFYKWSRTYAKIPPSRTAFESYSWTVPGIESGAIYAAQSISSAASAAGVTTITASSSPSISEDDQCNIRYTFTDAVTGTQYGRSVNRIALAGTSGTTIVVSLISEPGGTIAWQSIKKVEPGRAAEALEVGSIVQLDYYLPGVTLGVASPFDIPIVEALEIYDGDGIKTDTFTPSTTPALSDWRAQIAAKDRVCVVRSVVRRWMGNIYERATRYCVAQ